MLQPILHNTHNIFRLTIAIVLLCFLSSCEDDATPSKAPLLTANSWTLVKYEVDGVDITEDCQTDDTMTFFSDATYIAQIGSLECEEFDEDVEGSWKFKGNETIISLHPSGDVESDWEIIELTGSTFTIFQHVEILNADVIVVMTVKN